MLIIAGALTTEPGGREAFFAAVKPMVVASLDEPGCQEYAFTPDPNDDTRILLYELWDDQEALDGHFASAHMAAWQQASSSLSITGRSIHKYLISSVEDL